jgi:RNA polymerase sigma-54 factor
VAAIGRSFGPGIEARLDVRAAPELRAMHVLGMLPLAYEAVETAVNRALADNPMLRRRRGSPCRSCGRHCSSSACFRCTGTDRGGGREAAVRPFDTLEADAGCEIESRYRRALPVVISHLTGRGLLDCAPESIAVAHGLDLVAVAAAVRAIKAVGPVGVAERSMTGLLVAQAERLVAAGDAAGWFVDMVRDHLASVAAGDVAAVCAALGVDRASVGDAFRLVRARMRPSAAVESPVPVAVRAAPDVFVYRDRAGALEVEVADSTWFGLRLAAVPRHLRADAEAVAWLDPHERAARLLLQQLDGRAGVLRRVASWVVHRQAGFFDRGPAGHVHLTRTEVAGVLGLHPSTVSRAVAAKVVRCPDGDVIDFAELFGGDVAVKARILDLACRGRRLSDAELCTALAAGGHVVARRTVAKYRAQLGIPAAGQRRT